MWISMYRYDIRCRMPAYLHVAKRNVTGEIPAQEAEQSDFDTITTQQYLITPVMAL